MIFSVQIREAALKSTEEELRSLKSRNDDRVDKYAYHFDVILIMKINYSDISLDFIVEYFIKCNIL